MPRQYSYTLQAQFQSSTSPGTHSLHPPTPRTINTTLKKLLCLETVCFISMLVLLISTKVYKCCSSTKLRDRLFRFKIAISRRCSRLQSSFPLRQSLWNRRKSHIMACLCRHYDLPAGPAQTRKFSRHASGGNFDGEELSFQAQSLVLGSEISRESPTPAGFGGADLVTGFRAK